MNLLYILPSTLYIPSNYIKNKRLLLCLAHAREEERLGVMASEAATSNGTTDENHPKEKDEWKEGWLFKKTRYTGRWKLVWFQIRDGQLIYGCNEKVRVNLMMPVCSSSSSSLSLVVLPGS